MKFKIILIIFFLFLITSCSTSKKVVAKTQKTTKISIADKIIWTAVSYKGTPYKYGGTNKKGMDCSGLIFTSFKQRGIEIPRVSYIMATKGKEISLKNVKRGDLLFFKTSKTSKNINHVGLVTSVENGIEFIHSSTSKGVMVSSLSNRYWNNAFVKAKKIL